MNQQDRTEIQTIIQQSRQQAGFGTSTVPLHIHNGIDSPKILRQNLPQTTFIGHVLSTGGFSGFSPAGWTATKTSTGVYTITHTMNTKNYSVIAMSCQGGITIPVYLLDNATANFIIKFYNLSGVLTNTEFTLTVNI